MTSSKQEIYDTIQVKQWSKRGTSWLGDLRKPPLPLTLRLLLTRLLPSRRPQLVMPGRDHPSQGGCENSVRQHSCTSTGLRHGATRQCQLWSPGPRAHTLSPRAGRQAPGGWSPSLTVFQISLTLTHSKSYAETPYTHKLNTTAGNVPRTCSS